MNFLAQYKERLDNTRVKYYFIISAFFRWYSGERLPGKVKAPKILPQYVPNEDINRLLETLRTKRSHKKKIDRDILLVESFVMTGLRRSELANLKVAELHLDVENPVLVVRGGKGKKDRTVGLNSYIRDRLAAFTKGKLHAEIGSRRCGSQF